jgi:tetratricopeptide (TPR) repeat protein
MVRVEEAAERAIEHSMQAGNDREEAWARRWLVSSLTHGPKPVSEAIDRLSTELEWARSHGNRLMESDVLLALAQLNAMSGAFGDGRVFISNARVIATDLGMPSEDAWCARYSARLEMLAAKPRAAEKELRFACSVFETKGAEENRSLIWAALADALYSDNRYEEADMYASLSERYASRGDPRYDSRWKRVRAKLLARAGEIRQAEALGREAIDLLSGTDYVTIQANTLMDLAEIYRLADRPPDAIGAVREALSLYNQKGNVVAADKARALIGDPG